MKFSKTFLMKISIYANYEQIIPLLYTNWKYVRWSEFFYISNYF